MIIKSQLQSLANISCLLLPALACIADVKLLRNQQHVESATQAVLLQNYCSVHLNRNNDLKLSTHYTVQLAFSQEHSLFHTFTILLLELALDLGVI